MSRNNQKKIAFHLNIMNDQDAIGLIENIQNAYGLTQSAACRMILKMVAQNNVVLPNLSVNVKVNENIQMKESSGKTEEKIPGKSGLTL